MNLTMREKQAVTRHPLVEYKRATTKQKGYTLDTLIKLPGYNHSYVTRVLRQRAKYAVVGRDIIKGSKLTLVEDERPNARENLLATRRYRRHYGRSG
jgi:hypothetical protein